MNYPNCLVPLDIALQLKAIGFDEPCHFQFLYYHGWEMLKRGIRLAILRKSMRKHVKGW